MIMVYEDLSVLTATKPMECPNCGYKRNFDVPVGACVRKSRRGKPSGMYTDMVLLKCKKCGHSVGISTE